MTYTIEKGDFKLGKTKVFLKDPKTLFALEEAREKYLPNIVIKMQKVVRGFLARQKYGKTRAAMRIIAFFRWARSKYYMRTVITAFKAVDTTPDFGMKTIQWPPAPPVLAKGLEMMQAIQSRWWAHEKLKTVAKEDIPSLEQKVLAYDIFHDNKPWTPTRSWEATYLERESNANRTAYTKSMQKLFLKYHDQNVMFCDYMDKRNSKNKMQRRGIVVTEAHIYKQDPKKFTVAQEPIPLASISEVVMSKGPDQLIVIHVTDPKCPDLLFDLTVSTEEDGKERLSEFVTVMSQAYTNVTGNTMKVVYQDSCDWKGKPKAKQLHISFNELENDLKTKRKPTTGGAKKAAAASPTTPAKGKEENDE